MLNESAISEGKTKREDTNKDKRCGGGVGTRIGDWSPMVKIRDSTHAHTHTDTHFPSYVNTIAHSHPHAHPTRSPLVVA